MGKYFKKSLKRVIECEFQARKTTKTNVLSVDISFYFFLIDNVLLEMSFLSNTTESDQGYTFL